MFAMLTVAVVVWFEGECPSESTGVAGEQVLIRSKRKAPCEERSLAKWRARSRVPTAASELRPCM